MADPIKWKSKILLVKVETTYGTDPTPTGAANAILAVGVSLVPMEGDDKSRDLELPYFGNQGTIPTGLRARIRGRVELVASGDPDTPPAWGPLLRACGVAETITATDADDEIDGDVTYYPVTDGHESVTVHFYIGTTRHVLKGARGTGTIRFNAQDLPYFEFDLLGLFATPSDQARPSVDLSDFQKPVLVTTANVPTFTIASKALVMRSFSMTLGNDVQPRLLVGREQILIVDKAERVQTTVEALPLADYDPYTTALNQTAVALVIKHGTTSGKSVTLTIPTATQRRPASLEQNQNILEWPLEFSPEPSSGNDQWSLKLA